MGGWRERDRGSKPLAWQRLIPLPPLSHHMTPRSTAPWANLFTNMNMGYGTRPFASGGRGDRGAHSGCAGCLLAAGAGQHRLIASCRTINGPPRLTLNSHITRHTLPPTCHSTSQAGQRILGPALQLGAPAAHAALRLWAIPLVCGLLRRLEREWSHSYLLHRLLAGCRSWVDLAGCGLMVWCTGGRSRSPPFDAPHTPPQCPNLGWVQQPLAGKPNNLYEAQRRRFGRG